MNNSLDLSLISIGKPLPDWTLEKIFEEDIPNKEAFLGKPLLILLFSLGCPGCIGRAIPYANRVVYENGDNIHVLGIHTDFEGNDFSQEKFIEAKKEFFIRFPFSKT